MFLFSNYQRLRGSTHYKWASNYFEWRTQRRGICPLHCIRNKFWIYIQAWPSVWFISLFVFIIRYYEELRLSPLYSRPTFASPKHASASVVAEWNKHRRAKTVIVSSATNRRADAAIRTTVAGRIKITSDRLWTIRDGRTLWRCSYYANYETYRES